MISVGCIGLGCDSLVMFVGIVWWEGWVGRVRLVELECVILIWVE